MLELLKQNKNFRNFWLSISITTIGDYIDDIAFAQLIYLVTNSTLLTSYVFIIKIIMTFFSILTAPLADRFNKKAIIIISSVGQAIILILILILYYGNHLNTFVLIAFTTIQTLLSTFITPAHNAMLPLLVSEEDMINARSTISIFMQFIQVFAYMCSGILIGWLGISGAILFDIITFFVSIIFMMQLNCAKDINRKFENGKSFLHDVKDGIQFVISEKVILSVIFVTFLGNIFTSPVDTLMPAYFGQGNFPSYSYSVFMICMALGGIVGSYTLTKIKAKFQNSILLSWGFLIGAIGILLLFFNISVFPYFSSILVGISCGFVSILNATIIQSKTPKEMTARTFSVFKCISYIASPLGIAIAGLLGEFIPMNIVFLPFGILLFVTSIVTKNLCH